MQVIRLTAILPFAALFALYAQTTLPDATQGKAYEYQFDAKLLESKGPKLQFTQQKGNLPQGLEFDGATGKISGTPTEASGSQFTIQVCTVPESADSRVLCAGGPETYFLNVKIAGGKSAPPDVGPIYEGQRRITGNGLASNGPDKQVMIEVRIDGAPVRIKGQAFARRAPTGADGYFDLELERPVDAGQVVSVVQIPPGDGPSEEVNLMVTGRTDWGRSRASLAFGGILSRDQGEFSSIDPFLSFTLDTIWHYADPDDYYADGYRTEFHQLQKEANQRKKDAKDDYLTAKNLAATTQKNYERALATNTSAAEQNNLRTEASRQNENAEKLRLAWRGLDHKTTGQQRKVECLAQGPNQKLTQGVTQKLGTCVPEWRSLKRRIQFNTFLQARLTSIPISAAATQDTAGTALNTTDLSQFLASQKSSEFSLGALAPILATQWHFSDKDYALYVAPIVKAGIYSPTTRDILDLPGVDAAAAAAQRREALRLYNYSNFGVRIGQFRMSTTRNVAPREVWRIDYGFGRYSNLKSVYGQRTEFWKFQDKEVASYYTRNDLRMVLDSYMNVPSTPFFIGFVANMGLNPPSAKAFDEKENAKITDQRGTEFRYATRFIRPARDDMRFVFGARIDIGDLLGKLGVK